MANLQYQVIRTVDAMDSGHTDTLTKQCKKVLSSLQLGQTFEASSFLKDQMPIFCRTAEPRNIANIGYRYLREGKRLGILSATSKDVKPISFDDFLQLDSVQYWLEQLSSTKYKNLKSNRKLYGTQETYAYQAWAFNNWLYSKDFEIHKSRQIDDDTFKQVTQRVTLNGIEQLLELYRVPNVVASDFIKIIKKYLLVVTLRTSSMYIFLLSSSSSSGVRPSFIPPAMRFPIGFITPANLISGSAKSISHPF